MNRQTDATCHEPAGTRYAHCVDLTPPPQDFSDEVEEQIIRFLERRSGTFDLYGEIATGDAYIRYCFKRSADADAFHGRFAPAAKKALINKVT